MYGDFLCEHILSRNEKAQSPGKYLFGMSGVSKRVTG